MHVRGKTTQAREKYIQENRMIYINQGFVNLKINSPMCLTNNYF